MEYGLSTYLYINERLNSHILDRILGAGFQNIELFAARQHLDYTDRNQVKDVAQWFRDHEVKLHSVHAPLFSDPDWGRSGGLAVSIAYLERRLRVDSMDEIKRALDIADDLPFRYLVVHMGLPEDEYDLNKFDAVMTSLEHLKVSVKDRGVQLLLENVPNQLGTPERLVQFIHHTHLNVGICFDTGHANMLNGIHPAFETLNTYIASTHVHDNRGEKDDHLMPFDGAIDWTEAVRDLRRGEGRFPVLFEIRDYGPNPTSLSRLAEVIERMEAIAGEGVSSCSQ
jgi:sugar phosphate isomerase/epimerase